MSVLDEFSAGDREADNLRLDTSPVEDDGFSQTYELLGLSSPAHSLSGTIKLPNPPPTDPAADAAATKLWSFVRLHVGAASGRQRDNVLRALNAATHELVPETNTGPVDAVSVRALLRKVAGRGMRVPITPMMDNARYKRCASVRDTAEELGIELLFSPSYSPNLNSIERLWKFVKKEMLNSRRHRDFKKFQEAIDGCLAEMPTKHRGKLATLLTHNFQTSGNVSLLNA